MEVIFKNELKNPLISVVIIDWSCRESFHTLYYLNNQKTPRQQYEIIWIEYYSRRSMEIKQQMEEFRKINKPPILDRWIVMDMPKNIYYHKHLMYNIGIIESKGE